MEQVGLWPLLQAQEAARFAVEQLVESARRSRVHKQQCHKVALAGREVFARLEAAVRERTGDNYILCSAAARLYSVVNSSRVCVEQFGNPSRLYKITVTIFQHPRKQAERALSDQFNALQDVAEEFASLWTSTPLRVPSSSGPLGTLPHSPIQPFASGPAAFFSAEPSRKSARGSGANALTPAARGLHNTLSSPVGLASSWNPIMEHGLSDMTPRSRVPRSGLLTNSPGPLGLSPQPSGLRMGAGLGSESLPLSPSTGSGEADALRSLPFGQRSVRRGDGNPVQQLCFMRGAGGESAAVQLMVVLHRQVEVYSAALDSFHSDTPLDVEAQQVTATALYEPTIDLITGHRGGTVLVYGRVGAVLSASASTLRGGVLSAAAAAATAAQQAGVPLVIRLSRCAVTALHCVPAIELEAATAAAAASASSTPGGSSSATGAAPANGAGGGDNNISGSESRTGGGAAASVAVPPAPSADAIASGAIGCCTADDVLLFTGDAAGRVMAVRYSRVQPEVLATTVFTSARRTAARNSNAPPSETPASPEITGLLYRSGCLLVSTSTDMYSIRVISAPAQQSTGNGNAGAGNGNGNGNGGEADGGPTKQAATLPQSTSINLLSPTASTMPGRNTGVSAAQPSPTSGGGAAGGATSGGGAATVTAATNTNYPPASGTSGEPIIRRGPLNLTSTLVDTFPFADFDSCTALVAIDWPVPDGGQPPALTSGGDGAAAGSTSAAVPRTPRGCGGGIPGLTPTTYTSPLASWMSGGRDESAGGGAAGAAANGSASVGGAASAGSSQGRIPKFVTAKQGPWRMLSAHNNGQLLMWDVTACRLQLICAIGQPGPSIVNVFTFPELATMVELLSTGHIRVGPLPTSSLAPPINPLGNVPVWQFGRASMRAHRGRLTSGAALANCIATGSRAGGVKVHSAVELRAQAARQNVAFLTPWTAAGGRSAAGTSSPTASVPYAPSEQHYPAGRGAHTGGPPGSGGEEPPFHGGPPGGPSAMTSVPASIGNGPFASHGGAYLAYSRMPSGHTSLASSHLGLPSGQYPFMPQQMHVQAADAFGSAYAMTQPSLGAGGPGAPQQRVPGPSGGGAPAGEPNAPPQPALAAKATGRGLPTPSQVIATTPFATQPLEGPEALSIPRGGGATGGNGGLGDALRYPLSNGFANGNGLANGHGHALRSEDSMGNLSVSSSVVNGGHKQQAQQQQQQQQQQPAQQQQQQQQQPAQQQQRSTQGPKPAAAPTLARVSERQAGDSTPTRTPNKQVGLTDTERAVMGIFGQSTPEEAGTKLPTVGPIGWDPDEAATAAATEKLGAEGAPPAPGQESHPPPPHPQPHQHFAAPPSPVATSGAALLPHAVRAAAQDPYGSPYGGGGGLVGMPPGSATAAYPNMPTVGTAAMPQPPPHAPHAAHSGGLAMPQAQRGAPQMLFTTGAMDPLASPHQGYNSPPPPGHMYCGTSPLASGGGAPPSPRMGYGPNFSRMSDLGAVPPPPYANGGQHVPGPQLGGNGRRPSNLSEYDFTGHMSPPPFEVQGAGADEVGLPPPPVVRPPPMVVTAPAPRDPQLSQNCFIRSEEVRNIEEIGQGAEGVVYRGRWHHIDVAVKEMLPTSDSFNRLESMAQDLSSHDAASTNKELANLIKEVAALIDLGQHPNIIRFIGVCASPPRIVTEYYKMGSLYTMIRDARQGNIRTREKLSWDKRLIMLKDIAAGMAFLHSRDYIHGDLRSPNVFVTEDQHLKLGDFGFARILGKAQNCVVPARLTNPRWQAPEVYDMTDPIATTAADVYSFGIIMYEMLTFRLPYDDVKEDGVVMLRHTLDPAWRPHVPLNRELPLQKSVHREGHLPPLQAYKTLMMDCWAEKPEDRPGFHKIATRLNALCHWQYALTVIQRGLRMRQMSRPRTGSGADASADVTPSSMTPTSVRSPTASRSGPPLPSQVLKRILEVANTLEQQQQQQQQQGSQAMDHHVLERLRQDEQPFAAASSPITATVAASQAPSPAVPTTAAALAPVLPLLPPLPPLQTATVPAAAAVPAAARQAEAEAQPQYAAAANPRQPQPAAGGEAVDSPTKSRTTAGFAQAGGSGSAASAAAGGGGAPDTARRLAAPPLSVLEPPTLETAPTLASTGSRPLQVSAASTPPRFPPGTLQMALPAAAAAVAAESAAELPPSPPPFPASRGGDSHSLSSPFQGMCLSDDEDDAAPMTARPPVVAAGMKAAAAAAPRPPEPRTEPRPQPPAPGLPPRAPSAAAGRAEAAAPPPPPLGTASSVAVPAAAALMPSRMASASAAAPPAAPLPPPPPPPPAAPLPTEAGLAAAMSSAAPAELSRVSSFQPTPQEDPLEMRTAFHMGMGFSIEDDEDD